MDGATGTELRRAGLREGEYGERWNLRHPEKVQAIHRAYVEAGAEVLLTNTFQIDRAAERGGEVNLTLPWPHDSTYGLAGLQWSAYALVLADLGPTVDPRTGREFPDLKRLIRTLAAVGTGDGVLLETCSTPRARYAVNYGRLFTSKPVLLSLTFRRGDGRLSTVSGHPPEWFAKRAGRWELWALGVNCGRDIDMGDIIEIIRRYRDHTDLPLFARPNAGTPTRVGDQWVYPRTPEDMAARLPELLEAGVSMVGGCCGTTPAHIAAFRPVVDAWNRSRGLPK
jgi:methionine synthase I (cobalamin-dependent)